MKQIIFYWLIIIFIGIFLIKKSVIIAASVLAIKYNEDDYYANTFYAKVGGITLEEINQLEYDFLAKCDFNMSINQSKYIKYHDYLSQFNDE